MAALTKRGLQSTALTPRLDQQFEEAYAMLLRLGDEAGVEPTFSYRTNQLHGVSKVLRDTIDAASRNDVVSLENPSFKRMKPKLTPKAADYHLNRLPISEEVVNSIVDACFSELLTNEATA
jgi:hypothetical protein